MMLIIRCFLVKLKKNIKKTIDYLYLLSKGVDTKFGYCCLIGNPVISKIKGSKIIIEEGVTIVSKTKGNIAGVNNPTILATLDSNAKIILKKGSGISGSKIVSAVYIELGEYSGIGVNSSIYDTDFHPIESNKRRFQRSINEARSKAIIIGEDVLIGAQCIVLKGSNISSGCVIGAGSVVSGQVLDKNFVYAGNPLKKVKKINNE
ncbi:MAG: hypothetical protein WBA64_11730 [Marinomonas sp.]|uniref:hypothetical protein n=1 Tax=Marinomonas sp. TaxID=1904862 RepID=UPI003C7725FB